MRPQKQHITTPLALAIAGLFSPAGFAEEVEKDTETMVVRGTAEEALKQQPGVSIITAEDIAKAPRLTISQKSSVKCPA